VSATRSRFRRAKPPHLSPADIKAVVRHRGGYRCVECGMTARQHVRLFGRTLDVHRTLPGEPYSVRTCVSLCRPCHLTKPKSPPGTQRPGKQMIVLPCPADLLAVIDRHAEENGRTRPAEIVFLLRQIYQSPDSCLAPCANQGGPR
jgi:hypothetical protein